MDKNRPVGRQKKVTGGGGGVYRRGKSGAGQVGGGIPGGGGRGSGGQRGPGGMNPLMMIIALIVVLLGGGGGAMSLLNGGSSSGGSSSSYSGYENYHEMISSGDNGGQSGGWASSNANTGKLNMEVAEGARDKFTQLKGNGQDEVNIMVYLCGTDLESRSAMATRDLQEMLKAKLSDKVHILIYTGGCKKWQNNAISSSKNEIYEISTQGLSRLENNMGAQPMTDSETLSGFIQYGHAKYKNASRNILIFWDHGGGSVSGYGYDEKYPRSGSMSLAGIQKALEANKDVKFDIIGFDACLMATAENALMLSKYADYMLASEETEPGIGWYYTNWLSQLSANTSISTPELSKIIIDDFVSTCASQCRGQGTTLSVVDLAELGQTLPQPFKAFSEKTQGLIKEDNYKAVSNARNSTREFATSSRIDQIDLVHFAMNLGTKEGKDLAEAVGSAVKYNRTSTTMTNAYGLSVYFPYRKTGSGMVASATDTYEQIGLDESYSACIKEFAGLQASGQVTSGGTGSPLGSLFGDMPTESSQMSSDDITALLNAFLGGNASSVSGMSPSNYGFLTGRSLSLEDTASYIEGNQFDTQYLFWTEKDGQYVLTMPEEQWDLIQELDLCMFYDDGEGYMDLGKDNVYDFNEDGDLIGATDNTWVYINEHPVAYYRTSSVREGDDFCITGFVPAFLNGEEVRLIVIFDNENPDGYVAGARKVYAEDETDTEAKGLEEIKDGDKLDFTCDYYTYDREFEANYFMGDPMTVSGELTISNKPLGGKTMACYRLTDIYGTEHYTEMIPE